MLTIKPYKFAKFFSKINIVRNSTTVACISLYEKFVLKVPIGNTRAYPTLYIFKYSLYNDCKSTSSALLNIYKVTCKPRKKELTLFQCSREGCTKSFESKIGLQTHVSRYYRWHARKCVIPDCSDKVFTNIRS